METFFFSCEKLDPLGSRGYPVMISAYSCRVCVTGIFVSRRGFSTSLSYAGVICSTEASKLALRSLTVRGITTWPTCLEGRICGSVFAALAPGLCAQQSPRRTSFSLPDWGDASGH